MSVLSYPRLYFQGHAYWNPATFNNNDAIPTFDASDITLNNSFLEQQGLDPFSPGFPDRFRKWATTTLAVDSGNGTVVPLGGDPPPPALPSNVTELMPPGEWNYFGGSQCGLVTASAPEVPGIYFNQTDGEFTTDPSDTPVFSRPDGGTALTGAQLSPGESGYSAISGTPVEVNLNPDGGSPAKMVDVNPQCFWSTQLFSGGLQVGSAGSGTGFTGPLARRLHSQNLNLSRVVDPAGGSGRPLQIAGAISCAFQACVKTSALTTYGNDQNIPGLSQLLDSLNTPGVIGLMVRYNIYINRYFNGPYWDQVLEEWKANGFLTTVNGVQYNTEKLGETTPLMNAIAELYQDFDQRQGGSDSLPMPLNQNFSQTVGSIGLWQEGELSSTIGGRFLAALQPSSPGLGPAALEIDEGSSTVVIDLGATFPEQNPDGDKADLGTITLSLSNRFQANITALNNKATYDRTAGIIEVPFSDLVLPQTGGSASLFDVLAGSFAISASASGVVPLTEQIYTARTAVRGSYLNNPVTSPRPPSDTIRLQVRFKDAAPPSDTVLLLAEYAPEPPNFNSGGWQLVNTPAGGPAQLSLSATGLHSRIVEAFSGDQTFPYTASVVPVPADGDVELTIAAAATAGFPNLRYMALPEGELSNDRLLNADPGGPALTPLSYSVVRITPSQADRVHIFQDLLNRNAPKEEVEAAAFDLIFLDYNLIYPFMSFIATPQDFEQSMPTILKLTSPGKFGTPSYMPVTRSLTVGRQTILALYAHYLGLPRPLG